MCIAISIHIQIIKYAIYALLLQTMQIINKNISNIYHIRIVLNTEFIHNNFKLIIYIN